MAPSPTVFRLALVIVALVFLGSPAEAFIRGDVDGNGNVNALVDGLFLLSFGFVPGSPEPPCPDAADVDDDGSMSALVDGLYLLNFGFVLGSPPPPAPYPMDGSDPTLDGLPPGDCGGGPLTFETIDQGTFSGAPTQTSIFRDQASFEAFWSQHANLPPPVVDFATEMVVVVLREFGTGGYSINIDQLVATPNGIEVEYTLAAPLGFCPVILIFTQPFHIVRAPTAPGDPIEVETLVDSCP